MDIDILRYRLLSHITFGAVKRRYRSKYKALKNKPLFWLEVSFNAENKSFSFQDFSGFDCRNISTMKLFATALSRIRYQLKHSFKVPVITDDFAGDYPLKCFGYAKKDGQANVTLIPDFFFDGWASIGCDNYDAYMDEIVKNSFNPPMYNKLFWSGSLDIHPMRVKFFEASKVDDRLECLPINWKREELTAGKKLAKDVVLELKEFNRYKYLIDLPCRGYSGRFKALLFSGRPLFKVVPPPNTQLKEYFYDDLKPFVHYIPVRNDLNDLNEQLNWAEDNYDKALEIAKNAQIYALEHLRTENAIAYLEKLLLNL